VLSRYLRHRAPCAQPIRAVHLRDLPMRAAAEKILNHLPTTQRTWEPSKLYCSAA
jgi:hypothetical protein